MKYKIKKAGRSKHSLRHEDGGTTMTPGPFSISSNLNCPRRTLHPQNTLSKRAFNFKGHFLLASFAFSSLHFFQLVGHQRASTRSVKNSLIIRGDLGPASPNPCFGAVLG